MVKIFAMMVVFSLSIWNVSGAAEVSVGKDGGVSLDKYCAQFEKSAITDKEYLDQIAREKKSMEFLQGKFKL